MKTIKGIMATTHIDRHSERMALSALQGMADQVAAHYITTTVEHDPRYPPYGRVVDAEVVQLPDGEYGLETTTEVFDWATSPPSDGRTIALEVEDLPSFAVGYDRSVSADDADGDVAALAMIAGRPPRERGKKALEPIAELVLQFGLFSVGAIAAGFLAKAGADGWDAIRERLRKRYEKARQPELLQFSIGLDVGYPSELIAIIPNPSQADVDAFFDTGVSQLDQLAVTALHEQGDLARIVVLWTGRRLRLEYAVRPDGFPVLVDWTIVPALPESLKGRLRPSSDSDGADKALPPGPRPASRGD